ncbi:hypothetical protein COCOBI_11-0050 [Coccomyxa sp. Obi]|nr:hypothetical protein COCOBI_11-0050 [Coccomyxa sp. Obi]
MKGLNVDRQRTFGQPHDPGVERHGAGTKGMLMPFLECQPRWKFRRTALTGSERTAAPNAPLTWQLCADCCARKEHHQVPQQLGHHYLLPWQNPAPQPSWYWQESQSAR